MRWLISPKWSRRLIPTPTLLRAPPLLRLNPAHRPQRSRGTTAMNGQEPYPLEKGKSYELKRKPKPVGRDRQGVFAPLARDQELLARRQGPGISTPVHRRIAGAGGQDSHGDRKAG